MPVIPSSIPKLVPNITNADIQTCEPWGMTVSGGTPPYTVTLAALGAPVFTNVNSPNITDYNRFTYVNRADPGTDLIGTSSICVLSDYYILKIVFTAVISDS
jgi:hypothetical protein